MSDESLLNAKKKLKEFPDLTDAEYKKRYTNNITGIDLKDEKWNTVKFIKGWINHKFLAFVITTLMIKEIIFGAVLELSEKERIVIFVIWGLVTMIFILGKSIDNAIYNAHISAEFKAGANITKGVL